jgi:hypothetical protein
MVLLCSCTTTSPTPELVPAAEVPATELPPPVAINQSAGRGGLLFVTLRLDDGKELPFVVDSGSSGTFIDQSLEPRLGKSIGKKSLMGWGGPAGERSWYTAPKLYLGKVRLLTGPEVVTEDFRLMSVILGQPVKGVLGIDCLAHYRIQLDFGAGQMKFLTRSELKGSRLKILRD